MAAGDLVQHMPGVEDLLIGGADLGAGRRGHPRRGDGLDGVHVALAAARLLQVRLEEEGQLAVYPSALVVQLLELGEPGPRVGAPVLQRALAQPCREVGIPGHVPGVQQAEGDLEVIAGHPARLRDGAHRVVQARAGIPDGVPDPVGYRGDAVPAIVQQQHVEVASGEQFLAAVPADGDERHSGLGPEHPGQPAIGFGRPSASVGRVRGHHAHQVPRLSARAGNGHARGTGPPITVLRGIYRAPRVKWRQRRARRCERGRPSRPERSKPSRHRSAPSARPSR